MIAYISDIGEGGCQVFSEKCHEVVKARVVLAERWGQMPVKGLLDAYRIEVNEVLSNLLVTNQTAHATLFASMNYSLLVGGKRIRPILFFLVLHVLGKDHLPYRSVACALECVHTYSLIHDDLPCMDDDDYRRGHLTNHKVYGAGMATMAGDGLLTFAFELLAKDEKINPILRCKILTILAHAAGPEGMVGGQAQDIEGEGKNLSLEEVYTLDACKTGCLLTAPVDMAMEIAEVSDTEKEAFHRFGIHLGILFQITDDILDAEGTFQTMGKQIKKDESHGKSTYVRLLGIEGAKEMARQEYDAAVSSLGNVSYDIGVLSELATYILTRGK